MIKTGDKGTIGDRPARVIADDLKGNFQLVIAVIDRFGSENVYRRQSDGSRCGMCPFIPSKPWDSLKPGDACFVREYDYNSWEPSIFAGVGKGGAPLTFNVSRQRCAWSYCLPAKIIDGELVPVETAGEQE